MTTFEFCHPRSHNSKNDANPTNKWKAYNVIQENSFYVEGII